MSQNYRTKTDTNPEIPNKLTEGSLFRGTLRLAGPMLVGSVLSNAQSLIDLFWVGRLGSDAVAALALSGTVMMMLFPVLMGMAAGTVALISRAVGAGDHERAGDVAAQALILALVLGLVIGILGWALAPTACRLLGASAEVKLLSVGYLRIVFAGSFTLCLLFIGNSVLQGAGNTVLPTVMIGLANLLNLVLDPLLIFGLAGLPALGVRGAGLATVLSQAMAAMILLSLFRRGTTGIRIRRAHYRVHTAIMMRIARIGLPGMGQMLARSLMSLVLMGMVAKNGTAAVAAYGIGLRFHMIVLMPAFALGASAATLVGQNLGADKPRRAAVAAWLTSGVAVGVIGLAAFLLAIAAPQLIRIFDDAPEIIRIGTAYLRTVSPFYIFAALAIVTSRAMMGAGETLPPMLLTILCLWGVQVPLAIVLSRVMADPTMGVWLAIAAATTLHGLLNAAWFATGRWKHARV